MPPPPNAASCGGGGPLRVHFYDVGQGLAALVDLPDGRHILVDAGDAPRRPECGSVCAVANQHLLQRLRADLRGAPIDLVWITHQHSDHIGGVPDVLAAFPVTTYVDNGQDAQKPEVRRAHVAADQRGVSVRVVDPEHPDAPFANPRGGLKVTAVVPVAWPSVCSRNANDCSIGLRVDYCSSSVLFTGDAEHAEEAKLDLHGPVTLLQVAHHGSDTSTTPAFLTRARPAYVVISAGKPGEGMNADYCLPRAPIVRRLTQVLGVDSGTTLRAFDGLRCDRAEPTDWVDVPASSRLWATERDGDVVLGTLGDGAWTRE